MISELFASSRISLFARLRNFPSNPDSKGRLIRAFQQAFPTEREGDDFVNQWIASQRHAPYEADIWEAGAALKATAAPQGVVRASGCPLCSQPPHSPGWLHISDLDQGTSTQCVCRGGNPQLAEQARYMTAKWCQYPLGDQTAKPVTMEQLQAKIRSLARKKSMPPAAKDARPGQEAMRPPVCLCATIENDSGSLERVHNPMCQRHREEVRA